MTSSEQTLPQSIVLFDGSCNMCNASVRFITAHDHRKIFRCYSRHTPEGLAWMERAGLSPDKIDSVVLIEGSKISVRTTASLRIARRLDWPWPIFYAGIIVPAVVRDFFYKILARNRHRWFGKTEACDLNLQQRNKSSLTSSGGSVGSDD